MSGSVLTSTLLKRLLATTRRPSSSTSVRLWPTPCRLTLEPPEFCPPRATCWVELPENTGSVLRLSIRFAGESSTRPPVAAASRRRPNQRVPNFHTAAIAPVVAEIEKEIGPIDVLVNNAGYGHEGLVEESSMEDLRHQFEVNVFGPVAVMQAVLPYMRKRRSGHILNVTLPEFNIVETSCFGISSCFFDHCWSEVNSDYLSSFACFMSCDKGVIACTAAEINDSISFFNLCKLRWQPTAQT